MKIIYFLAIIVCFLFAGCVSCPPCPAQDSVISLDDVGLPIMLEMKKGFFDTPGGWITQEQYDSILKEWGLKEKKEPKGSSL